MKYYSQYLQDYFIDVFCLKKKQNGFFIDIGAYDGITFSNTLFFERERAWKGICVEPIKSAYDKLVSVRSCQCINGCISSEDGIVQFRHVEGPSEMLSGIDNNYDPRHIDRISKEVQELGGNISRTEVKSYNLNSIIRENHINEIDFLSIDVEGSELSIIKTINFDLVKINFLAIENNYRTPEFRNILCKKGYSSLGYLCSDEIFIYGGNRKPFLKFALFIFSYLVRIKKKLND